MEEILASIRRILADNRGLWNREREEEGEPDETDFRSAPDGLDRAAGAARPGPRSHRPDVDGPGAILEPQATTTRRRDDMALVSAATESSVAEAFQALVASRLVQHSDLLEDLTREMIRPMLEAWLDANLPALVERLVAAEIARIARGE